MEKQFSSDLEPVKLEKTSIYMDGRSQSQEISPPNGIYKILDVGDAEVYFLDILGELTLHIHMNLDEPVTVARMKRYYNIFLMLVLHLEDRGMTTIKTWIEDGNEAQRKLAKFFGFTETDNLKLVTLVTGDKYYLEEMEFTPRGH